MKEIAIITYVLYIVITVLLTVWVARTLHKNGRLFVIDAFSGNVEKADAVNHLLKVGFYLVNLGFVLMFLRYGIKPHNTIEAIEYITTKVGIVLLVLGAMHFFNMFNFNKMRKKGKEVHA